MEYKFWAFFGLTVMLIVLGWFAAKDGDMNDTAISCTIGAFCTGLITWAMTTY